MVESAKIAQKKKAWSFKTSGKQPAALNDTSSETNKLENLLAKQKILKGINN